MAKTFRQPIKRYWPITVCTLAAAFFQKGKRKAGSHRCKAVDSFKAGGKGNRVRKFIEEFDMKFKFW